MANFATETDVREKFQLTDTTLVPVALVTRSIDDAHEEVLRFLDPQYDVPSPVAALVLGETLLAGAHLLRSLASSEAFGQKRLSIGGNAVQGSPRFQSLSEAAAGAETRAWETLQPFVAGRPARDTASATDTMPVIEEV